MGESQLFMVLNKMFPTSCVNDMTGQKASGDFMLKRINKTRNLDRNQRLRQQRAERRDRQVYPRRGTAEMQRDFSLAEQRYLVKGELPDRIQQGHNLVYIHNCDYAPNGLKLRWI
jgi:hypothetical protein